MLIDKPYLSVNKQITKLKSQGLSVRRTSHVIDVLRTHSYYSFVNGYCDLLVKSKSPRVFKSGASFTELEAIYNFDTCFRRFLFPQILYIEEKIKAKCISEYCGEKVSGSYVNNMNKYLDINSYDTLNLVKTNAATNLISDFNKAINSNINNKNAAFVHAQNNYGYVPFWVLSTNLSFGQISKFYECLKYDIREKIAKIYKLSEKDLRTALKILNNIRNCCAHNNRVYIASIPPIFSPTIGLSGYTINVDKPCDHKFGSVLFVLKFLLSKSKFDKLIVELGKELTILKRKLKTIRIQDVLLKMGITPNMVKNFNILIK